MVSRHGIKMKAAVAVQRKLLEMIYTIYKTNTPFDNNYLKEEIIAISATRDVEINNVNIQFYSNNTDVRMWVTQGTTQ